MSERRLSALLRSTPIPGEREAEDRTWELVREAHAGATRSPSNNLLQGFGRRRSVAAVLAAAALTAAALSPPGRAVLRSLGHAVAPVAHPRSELGALPTRGDVLVTGANGAWIVHADGSKRRLGAYRDATWSPHGRFVAAAQGRQLLALDPQGHVRWTLVRARPVRLPAWSPAPTPDDTRIAYLAGAVLHIVGGDSRGDRAIADAVAPARPAWRPRARFVLAFASAAAVQVYAVEPLRLLWRARVPATPKQLVWSTDGSRLLALSPRGVRVFDASGRLLRRDDHRAVAAAFVPGTRAAFEVRRHGTETSVVSLASGRAVFAAPGEIDALAFSPDARWMLLGWRSAGQWLFLRRGTRRVVAVADVARAFDSTAFPQLAGWCCPS